MKNFAKVSLITAGILFLIGAIILIICGFLAGNMRGSLSDDVSTRLHSTLNGSILQLWDDNAHHKFNDNYPIHSGDHTDDDAAGGNDITELYIDLNCAYFTLAPSQDDCFHISSVGNGRYQYYTDGSAFYINGYHNRGANTSRLTLEVPNIVFSDVDISFGVGSAYLWELKSDTLTLNIGAGELTLEEVLCSDLSAEVGAGTVTIQNGQTTDADLEVGMGNLTYQGSIAETLDAEVGMGNISLQLSDSQDMHNYHLECNMGTVTLGSKEYGGLAFETQIDNGADSDYTLECAMGNIDVTFQDIDKN